ncbi:MAG TPA: thioredoxin domain-containing protein [Candidatus Absconditabacterales bacterium]|nr:thioredoxin domain-containing protein [Candidatus Absconditabacterales bacterium]HNG97540.1 thioredoxin domain-containing protein [Candidatus Absconditabacterales bacterium]
MKNPEQITNSLQTVSIISLVVSLLTFGMGVSGYFGSSKGINEDQVKTIVNQAIQSNTQKQVAVQPTQQQAPAGAGCQGGTAQPTQQAVAPNPTNKLEVTKFKDFYASLGGVKGNKDAKATIIYFADVECPFCQRHSNNKTLDAVLTKYGDKVNVAYAHFPLGFHPLAQKAGESIECAKKIGGFEKGSSFTDSLYTKTQAGGGKPTLEIIKATAEAEGIDVIKLTACLDSNEMANKVSDQQKFGQLLGVTGTPGNIVVNNESGEYTKVSGAVPATSFEAVLDTFVK